MNTETLLTIAVGVAALLLGLIAGWWQQHRHLVKTVASLHDAIRERDLLDSQLQSQKERFEEETAQMTEDFEERRAEQKEHYQQLLDGQQQRFDETVARVQEQVKSATNEMLKQRQREFAETSNTNIGQIVGPLKETIEKMKQAMDDNTLKQTSMSSEMRSNLESMMRQSEAAQKSTEELTRVFKFGTKVQGDWGETILDELLHSQGLTEGVHYDLQTVMHNDEGRTVRPDVILHLDRQRELIIDAKVSLTAFMDFVNADNEDDRRRFLKDHVESLKNHVRELASKDYTSYIQPPKTRMDYVIMFVPHTGALWTALNAKPDLWRKAMEQNVFIADEQTLFAALRIIDMTWTQIRQAEQHEQVYKLATEMLDRVGQFMKHYKTVGDALDKAKSAYENGERKLNPSGQSILNTAAKLTKLGAKQSTKNPIPQIEN